MHMLVRGQWGFCSGWQVWPRVWAARCLRQAAAGACVCAVEVSRWLLVHAKQEAQQLHSEGVAVAMMCLRERVAALMVETLLTGVLVIMSSIYCVYSF